MRAWVVVALMLVSLGCRVDREPMDAAHAKRVRGINRDFSRDAAENDRHWNELEKQVLERRRFLVPIEPGTKSKPMNPVLKEFIPKLNACQGTADQPAPEALKTTCEEAVGENYLRAFGARYFMADLDWVAEKKRADPDLDVEWLATKSHNKRLRAEITSTLNEIKRRRSDFRVRMLDARDDRILRSELQRDDEVEEAEREHRAAWAAALEGMGRAMQNFGSQLSGTSDTSSSAGPGFSGARAYVPGGCTSDFSCGVGKKCVKQYFKSEGVCMRAVNEFGLPNYKAPDPDSVMPNMPSNNSCSFGTCPIGFRCDFRSGVCVK